MDHPAHRLEDLQHQEQGPAIILQKLIAKISFFIPEGRECFPFINPACQRWTKTHCWCVGVRLVHLLRESRFRLDRSELDIGLYAVSRVASPTEAVDMNKASGITA